MTLKPIIKKTMNKERSLMLTEFGISLTLFLGAIILFKFSRMFFSKWILSAVIMGLSIHQLVKAMRRED